MPVEHPVRDNPLDELLGYRLRRLSAELMSELAHDLAAFGLTPVEASILRLIHANPGITQSEIGRILEIRTANMAPLSKRLVGAGLVHRKHVDGRSHGLSLTGHGDERACKVRIVMDRQDAAVRARLSDADAMGFANALVSLSERVV